MRESQHLRRKKVWEILLRMILRRCRKKSDWSRLKKARKSNIFRYSKIGHSKFQNPNNNSTSISSHPSSNNLTILTLGHPPQSLSHQNRNLISLAQVKRVWFKNQAAIFWISRPKQPRLQKKT